VGFVVFGSDVTVEVDAVHGDYASSPNLSVSTGRRVDHLKHHFVHPLILVAQRLSWFDNQCINNLVGIPVTTHAVTNLDAHDISTTDIDLDDPDLLFDIHGLGRLEIEPDEEGGHGDNRREDYDEREPVDDDVPDYLAP